MVRDFSQKTVQELYETIRVNVDEEEQWKVFDFVEDFFMEELEIGDYINDINSYHLHMFDKHDVTTKKFDAIVEKAGKVDANYAAQIEGYCSLLGEYGKKFEAVCAMLQPEKLRLSPDKYREKLEGINTGYQNAKDTHEQEQSAYEAELYEIETVWYKKMLDKAEDYLIRSAECVVLGNFADEVTVLGVAGQFAMGFFDLDLPCDIRDIIADVRNLAKADDIKWDMIAMLALDLIGVIPVIGALKYSDEIGTLFKNADKVSVVARSTDGTGVLAKHADEAGAWLHGVKVFRYSDETAEAVTSGEKLLTESGTIYESFADMMSPEDAKRYLDFLENGSREGLTSAELDEEQKAHIEAVKSLIMNEVNVKEIKFVDGAAGVLVKKVKCDFKKLGPKFGKQMKAVAAAVAEMSQEAISELEKNGKYTLNLNGEEAVIEVSDVEIISEDIPGWLVANEGKLTVALEVTVTEELRREGIARELVNRIQNIRKSSGFEITDKIKITISKNTQTDDAVNEYNTYICNQVLGTSLELVDEVKDGTELSFDDFSLFVNVIKD